MLYRFRKEGKKHSLCIQPHRPFLVELGWKLHLRIGSYSKKQKVGKKKSRERLKRLYRVLKGKKSSSNERERERGKRRSC